MRSQDSTVASRCAITSVVRPASAAQRRLHQRLALGIERGGRLVEQQQRRVAQDRARDRDALALAARQRDAALADRRVVACGSADEFAAARSSAARSISASSRPGGRSGCCRARSAKIALSCGTSAMRGATPRIGSATRTPSKRTCRMSDRRSAGSGGRSCSCRRRRADDRDLLAGRTSNDTPSSTGVSGRAG
jgi:hypothetical protein